MQFKILILLFFLLIQFKEKGIFSQSFLYHAKKKKLQKATKKPKGIIQFTYYIVRVLIQLYFKLARVVMGNLSKQGEKYEKYYYLKCFTRWCLTKISEIIGYTIQ